MILQSFYWKRDLKRLSLVLRRRESQIHWPKASYASLEKEAMLGFYAIRKLMDAFQPQLPVGASTLLPLTTYPSRGKPFLKMAWPEVAHHFDLGKPRAVQKDLRFICNQIIHSYVFT